MGKGAGKGRGGEGKDGRCGIGGDHQSCGCVGELVVRMCSMERERARAREREILISEETSEPSRRD